MVTGNKLLFLKENSIQHFEVGREEPTFIEQRNFLVYAREIDGLEAFDL